MTNGTALDSVTGKTILLVNTGSVKKKFILKRLKKLGVVLVCLNKEKNWAQPYVDHWILTNNANHPKAIEDTENFLASNPSIKINGVVTFWEDDVLLTARLADRFNLIGIPFKVAKIARNKYLFRKFCQEREIRVPQYRLIKTKADLAYVLANFKFPLVIKPTSGSSSAYVVKIENEEELYTTYNYVKDNISVGIESALAEGLDILIEEYIDGEEVDVDIVLQNGKVKFHSISDNYQTKEPFFVETGWAIPSSLPLQRQHELIRLGEEVLERLGVQNGVVHFEAKSTPTGPVPIEVNLRMGGDETHAFVSGAWGVDLIECAVAVAVGSYIPTIDRPELPRRYLASSDFLSEYSGVVSQLEIDERVKKLDYLEELHFFKKIGDPILVPPEGFEYLGWVSASGVNTLDAEDNLQAILKLVKYGVARFDRGSSLGKTSRRNRFSSAVLNKNLLMRAAKLEQVRQTTLENQRNLSIGILGDHSENNAPTELHANADLADQIKRTLKESGYQKVRFFDFNNPAKAFNRLKDSSVDLVLNICGKVNNLNLSESHAAALLEVLQLPYSGSSSATLSLCTDKIQVKKLLDYHKIPTPRWDYAYTMDDKISDALRYPLIVKPGSTNDSIGVTNNSVVTTKEQLKTQLERIIAELGQPALVEEYIEGDEYNVSILGGSEADVQVLPLSRSIFKGLPEGYWHILTYEAKWSNLPIYQNIVHQRPADGLGKKLESLITEMSLDAYLLLGCSDYGIVDIRVDDHNNPYVLEVNPNPPLDPNACLPAVAKLLGMDYGRLLEEIIRMAIGRYTSKKQSN